MRPGLPLDSILGKNSTGMVKYLVHFLWKDTAKSLINFNQFFVYTRRSYLTRRFGHLQRSQGRVEVSGDRTVIYTILELILAGSMFSK